MRGQHTPPRRRFARWVMSATAGLAALALLLAGLAGTAQAAYRGSAGRIAFVRGGNIYSIEPDGSGLHLLTHGGHDSGPRWSPDGRRLAYLHRGNLWIMEANGSHKTRITSQAPRYADARPSWSPNGRYLAFVRTRRHHSYGYLTRYDTVTHHLVTFSTPYHSEQPTLRQTRVAALPSAVAWGWALNATGLAFGSFIIFEGAGAQCPQPYKFCLEALGFPQQKRFRNGFPSAEYFHKAPIRLLDPDWFPVDPAFGTDVMTTQEDCPGGRCSYRGLDRTVGAAPILAGAYQGVYSPTGRLIAYVKSVRDVPEIYTALNSPLAPRSTLLTRGSQPDWQPVPPLPPS
jgi:hypothetical protein